MDRSIYFEVAILDINVDHVSLIIRHQWMLVLLVIKLLHHFLYVNLGFFIL